jgi:hypothetical protein
VSRKRLPRDQTPIKTPRPRRDRMASPPPPPSILLGDTLNPGTNPQPWQSCAPVARSAGQNHRPGRSRSYSADSANVLGQQRPSTLTAPSHISPAHGDVGPSTSLFRSIAVFFLALAKANKDRVRFCRKVYNESDHFSSLDPVRVCTDDLYCEAVQTFLDWSCSVSNFKSSSSLFTYSKGWRMGVVQHTGFPVNPVIKMDMKNVHILFLFLLISTFSPLLTRNLLTVYYERLDRQVRAQANRPIQRHYECGRRPRHPSPPLGSQR